MGVEINTTCMKEAVATTNRIKEVVAVVLVRLFIVIRVTGADTSWSTYG